MLLGSVRYSGPVFCLARPGICPGRVAGAGGVRGGWAPHTASPMGAASGGAGSFTFRLCGIHFDARRALRPIFVLHVFSYRCRSGDDQEWVDGLVNSIDQPFTVVVRSLGVIHGDNGDLINPTHANMWVPHIRAGRIFGVPAGPPCEILRAARYNDKQAPPPIRSAKLPWCANDLSHNQMQQILYANRPLQLTLFFVCNILPAGGRTCRAPCLPDGTYSTRCGVNLGTVRGPVAVPAP